MNKRLRFEILRRDGFRCTYCGETPSEAELHVDHVVPQALGGQDIPENLVTACEPCNSGKASSSPSEELVAAVNEAAAIEHAGRSILSDMVIEFAEGLDAFEDEVQEVWDHHVPRYRSDRTPGWGVARIAEWHRDRVPVSLIEFGLRVAIQADVPWGSKAAYAAAVVRNKIQEVDSGTHQNHQT